MTDVLKFIFQHKVEILSTFMKINHILDKPILTSPNKSIMRTSHIMVKDHELLEDFIYGDNSYRNLMWNTISFSFHWETNTLRLLDYDEDGNQIWIEFQADDVNEFLFDYSEMDEIMFKLTHCNHRLYRLFLDTKTWIPHEEIPLDDYLQLCIQAEEYLVQFLATIT